MRLAQRVNRLGTETAFEVLATVKQLEAEGRSIISFAIGEPDFDTPQNIKDAGCRAIQNNETHYGPSAGIMPLREAISKYISETRNISVKPEHVVVTPGAKPIIFHGILACVDPGDEVIYPNPGFPIYESMINFVGAKPVPLPLVEEKNFSFDVQQLRSLVTEKTKMIIINSPQNPTGGVLSKEDLEAVAELAIEHDLWVISDEIYSRLVFDGEFRSITAIPGMQERTIIIDGFSKTYAMTGWRLGYGVMNEKLAETVARLETNSESCTATFTQWAGLKPSQATRSGRSHGSRIPPPSGSDCGRPQPNRDHLLQARRCFYVYPNVTGACKRLGLADSREFQRYLLYEAGVAVLARTCFGKRNQGEDQEYVRLSYATSTEQIQEGLARIKKAVER